MDTQFDGQIERRPPPRRFTCEGVLEQVNRLPPHLLGNHELFGGVKRRRVSENHNWRRKSIFHELDYWCSNILKHNIDVMHVEKNVCDSLLGTILDNEKSKDTINARHDLKKLGVRKSLWIYEDERGKLLKPHAPYVLKPDDRIQFCKFIKDVKFPDGFCSNLKKKKQICSRTINFKDMEVAQQDLILILCKMESIFPPAFFDIMIHLVLHLPEEAILGGPVFMKWMYPFERYMKKLKNYVGNKARHEGSIAESYVIDEALTFCSMYFKGVETRLNRLDRNEDEVVPRKLSVFQSQCRPITKGNLRPLDRASREQIYDLHKSGSLENGKEFLALASGSDHLGTYYEGCIVNGVRFMATKQDEKRSTQNSGVFVAGTEGFNYYGTLTEVLKLTFTGVYSVTLFKCKWYNTNPRRKKTIVEKLITSINVSGVWYKDDSCILASQAKQVFYLDDLLRGKNWKIVENVNHRQIWDIVDDDDNVETDLVHDTNSSNFVLTVDLGELILLPNQPPMDIGTEPSFHVNKDDRNMDDEDATEESDEEILFDFCEDDVNDHLVNNDSDMDD
ncbi:uncharacterized protein LOC133032042 [Cannabis sativa]|uniref:uncharacterized protein LOC133032042 n=1 Tax=Cannabis sativa TaxID=3483 RepID=UPI0029CA0EF4|nr:uncharacterized protein LOC133032042 [Cannabis sativa]